MKKQRHPSVYKLGAKVATALLGALALMPFSASAADYNLLDAADPDLNKQYVRAAFGQVQNKSFNNADGRKKLLLIGDSQAQDFLNTAQAVGALQGYQIRTRHIPAQCQPFYGDPKMSGVESKDEALCAQVDSLTKAKPQIENADVIVFSSLWRDWAINHMPQTVVNLGLRDNQQVVIIGRKSFGRISLRHYLRMPMAKRVTLRNPINAQFLSANKRLGSSFPALNFVDQYALICGAGQNTCPVFTPEGELISFDGGHLTREGARFVGEKIFASPALSSL
ncbi:hypothetical protein EOL70_00525 [Leucothrix sargassi]|nr:hypothetical protein EOL70_00525 [Leucothrix sargassi]